MESVIVWTGRTACALQAALLLTNESFAEHLGVAVRTVAAWHRVVVSHETIRQWCAKFGVAYAAGLRRRRARAGDKWHLDEVFIKVNGVRQYLWRAVDQDGNVLDILVQSRRNTKAAKRFLAKLMKTQRRVPRVLVTDKLRSYAAAHRDLMSSVEHRQSKYLNNRARELPSIHPPARTSHEGLPISGSSPAVPGQLQPDITALPAPSPPAVATEYRTEMRHRFRVWNEVNGLATTP